MSVPCRLSVMSLQEVLACGVLLPLINQLSDPDYINQFVIWMVRQQDAASQRARLASLAGSG